VPELMAAVSTLAGRISERIASIIEGRAISQEQRILLTAGEALNPVPREIWNAMPITVTPGGIEPFFKAALMRRHNGNLARFDAGFLVP
jgi:hypothetical protein